MTAFDDPSGALTAEQAHASGQVVLPVELPRWSLAIEAVLHCTEDRAKEIAEGIARSAVLAPEVTAFAHTVIPR